MANLSDRIKSLRLSAKMTQEEFGTKFGIVKSTVSLYENGKSTPNDQIKKQICDYFHVSLDYLLGMDQTRSLDYENFQLGNSNDINHTMQNQSDNNGKRYSFFFLDNLLRDVFTSRLKKAMSHKGITTDKFSDVISFGKNKCESYINGDCEPSLEDLIAISQTLEVSIDYLLGQIDSQEQKVLNSFQNLSEDNKDIIIGEIKKCLKEQRYEESVTTEEPLRKTGTDNLGK